MKLTKSKLKEIIREEIQKLNEGNLPSNIQKWIRDRGPETAKDVKLIGKWVKQLTGRGISGGVAIGKRQEVIFGPAGSVHSLPTQLDNLRGCIPAVCANLDKEKLMQVAGLAAALVLQPRRLRSEVRALGLRPR